MTELQLAVIPNPLFKLVVCLEPNIHLPKGCVVKKLETFAVTQIKRTWSRIPNFYYICLTTASHGFNNDWCRAVCVRFPEKRTMTDRTMVYNLLHWS